MPTREETPIDGERWPGEGPKDTSEGRQALKAIIRPYPRTGSRRHATARHSAR